MFLLLEISIFIEAEMLLEIFYGRFECTEKHPMQGFENVACYTQNGRTEKPEQQEIGQKLRLAEKNRFLFKTFIRSPIFAAGAHSFSLMAQFTQ